MKLLAVSNWWEKHIAQFWINSWEQFLPEAQNAIKLLNSYLVNISEESSSNIVLRRPRIQLFFSYNNYWIQFPDTFDLSEKISQLNTNSKLDNLLEDWQKNDITVLEKKLFELIDFYNSFYNIINVNKEISENYINGG